MQGVGVGAASATVAFTQSPIGDGPLPRFLWGESLMIGRDAAAYSDHGAENALLTAIIGSLGNKIAVQVGAADRGVLDALLEAGVDTVYAAEPSPERATALRTAFAEAPAVHVLDLSISCQTLDSLVTEGAVPADVGLLQVDAAGSDVAVLQGLGRLFSAVVTIEYAHDRPGKRRACRLQRLRGGALHVRAPLLEPDRGQAARPVETLHVNDAQTRPGDRGAVVFIHDSVFPQLSFSVFAAASAAQTRLIDRAQNLAQEAERQLRLIEDLGRRLDHSSVAARLEVLEEQELALEEYCRVTRDDGPWQWVGQQLGVLYQYPPVPFYVPEHYLRAALLPGPPTISIVTPIVQRGPVHRVDDPQRSRPGVPGPRVRGPGRRLDDDDSAAVMRGTGPAGAHRVAQGQRAGAARSTSGSPTRPSGEIMAYLNSDDLLLPGSLELRRRVLRANPDVDVVYGHRVLIDADGREIGRWVLPRHSDTRS